jgi:hypothetical protein
MADYFVFNPLAINRGEGSGQMQKQRQKRKRQVTYASHIAGPGKPFDYGPKEHELDNM